MARRWEELEHHWLLEESSAELTTSRWHSQRWLIPKDGGSPTRQAHSVRVYSAHELRAVCHRCGLDVKEQFGGLDGSQLSKESRRLVTLAQRPVKHVKS